MLGRFSSARQVLWEAKKRVKQEEQRMLEIQREGKRERRKGKAGYGGQEKGYVRDN